MKLYHATTEKLCRKYHETGYIKPPVRGFTTLQAAMAWSMKVGRKVVLELDVDACNVHKLPDHHNAFGTAWWYDGLVDEWGCVFNAEKDA